MKSYSQIVSGFNQIKESSEESKPQKKLVSYQKPKPKTTLRERYITGEIFSQGEFVKSKESNTIYQIIECCTNYLRVIDINGRVKKVWIDSIEHTEPSSFVKESFIPVQKKDYQIFFKGYQTRNFTSVISEAFKPVLSHSDPFAVLTAIRDTDRFFETEEIVSKYHFLEHSGKFITKLNPEDHKIYRESMEAQVAEMLVENVQDILKITKNDRKKTAKIIASAVGIETDETDEVKLINKAARAVIKEKHSEEVMKIFGDLFKLATDVGIEWDKDIFTPKQFEKLGLKEEIFNDKWFEEICNEAAQSIQSFSDIVPLYEAEELKVVGDKEESVNDFVGDDVEEKIINALKTNPIKGEKPKQLVVAVVSDPKKIQVKARQFAIRYIRDRLMKHSISKLTERERSRLEDIITSKGSVITNATRNLSKKIQKLENERLMTKKEIEK